MKLTETIFLKSSHKHLLVGIFSHAGEVKYKYANHTQQDPLIDHFYQTESSLI